MATRRSRFLPTPRSGNRVLRCRRQGGEPRRRLFIISPEPQRRSRRVAGMCQSAAGGDLYRIGGFHNVASDRATGVPAVSEGLEARLRDRPGNHLFGDRVCRRARKARGRPQSGERAALPLRSSCSTATISSSVIPPRSRPRSSRTALSRGSNSTWATPTSFSVRRPGLQSRGYLVVHFAEGRRRCRDRAG